MTQVLSQKFEDLSLEESSKPAQSQPPPTRSLKPYLCAYPPSTNMLALEKAAMTLPVYYYGYLIDELPGGFLDYARTHVHPDCIHEWSTCDLFLLGINKIKYDARLRRQPQAKMVWVDSYAKDECPRVDQPVGRTVVVLPLFSNTSPSYQRRPTQEQVDLISSLLKQEPRWWQAAPM